MKIFGCPTFKNLFSSPSGVIAINIAFVAFNATILGVNIGSGRLGYIHLTQIFAIIVHFGCVFMMIRTMRKTEERLRSEIKKTMNMVYHFASLQDKSVTDYVQEFSADGIFSRETEWRSWDGTTWKKTKIKDLDDYHLVNVFNYIYTSNKGFSDDLRQVLRDEIDMRELSDEFVSGAPYPFQNSKGMWMIWDSDLKSCIEVPQSYGCAKTIEKAEKIKYVDKNKEAEIMEVF